MRGELLFKIHGNARNALYGIFYGASFRVFTWNDVFLTSSDVLQRLLLRKIDLNTLRITLFFWS